uniref:Pre-mRNA splicing Prp18-interacting factor n=1 Tax=Tanacetum cinerariifolium TaxID=118510 RepID=A0A6L2KSK7_TANCI|nr:hypothetical protein [Tanacetum cinerariifolium]
MSSFYEFVCYGCGGPSDTPVRYLCTCEQCENNLIHRTCLKCNSGAGNSFTYDPIPESLNEVQVIPNPPPKSHFNIYLCQICESNSHYGYECLQRVPLVYEPEPCYNQNFGDNAYTHDSPGVTLLIDHHCCYKYGDSLDDFFCHQCTSIAITFDLPIVEPEDSLRMGDEHLDTIPATESNKFIKSSVENLVPNPSKSEDLFNSECDVPACDDFTTFSNLLFDADDDLYSSDNESFFDEEISKKIYPNPLFYKEIISIKIDPHHFNIDSLLDEFTGFISKNSDAAIESFFPFPISVEDSDSFMEEIELSFTLDDPIPSGIEEDDYDSERDMLIFEELLSNDSISLPENESFHFDIPSSSRPPAKPPDDDSGILTVKMVGDISKHDVPMPKHLPTQPTLISNQEKSPHLLCHRGFKASQLHSECPMMIYGGNTPILDVLFLHFYPP